MLFKLDLLNTFYFENLYLGISLFKIKVKIKVKNKTKQNASLRNKLKKQPLFDKIFDQKHKYPQKWVFFYSFS